MTLNREVFQDMTLYPTHQRPNGVISCNAPKNGRRTENKE